MKNPPNIKAVRIVGALLLELDWSTGETLRIDLSDHTAAPFDVLHNPDLFAQVTIDEWGHGIGWADGLDFGADALYEWSREQAGLPTASTFDAWMARNRLSLASAAESLGMTRRMIAYYRSGTHPIPKVVGLALKGYEAEHHSAAE